jgi:predicted RNA-binding protein with PUA domain
LSLEDHDLLIEVDREFIEDQMNLIGLRELLPNKERYKESLKLLLSNKIPGEEDLQN